MRSRSGSLTLIFGVVGLAMTIPRVIPPLGESLLLGVSVGLILVTPVRELVKTSAPLRAERIAPEVVLQEVVKTRRRKTAVEREAALEKFDALISRVDHVGEPDFENVSKNFDTFVDRLTAHYPVWDSEGRLRTYVLMKKISESLDLHNADAYLDMAYRTLMARGVEASELSHITLNGKVERIYRDPESEGAHRLAGTLLLMNRGADEYAQQQVVDAVHLRSGARFASLKEDFAAVAALGEHEAEAIIQLLEKEMEKAMKAKDMVAAKRAKELWMTVLVAAPARPRSH